MVPQQQLEVRVGVLATPTLRTLPIVIRIEGHRIILQRMECREQAHSLIIYENNLVIIPCIEIISVGALPVSDRDEWMKSTKEDVSVVKMVLAPISELFQPSYVNEIPLDPSDPSQGNLDGDLLKGSFTNIMENYCKMMLGKV